ncbi:MAG: helix-turn-helix transcriptional regulator [Defluviitaleaceae bacterium]|nr:helix-turn-helix transcriptional regulator [Defluviitaleaceae bacterium]
MKETNAIQQANELNRQIGQRINKLRQAKGMSRAKLAEKIGISVPHLGLIERGERGVTILKCIRLSVIFDVSTDYILKG